MRLIQKLLLLLPLLLFAALAPQPGRAQETQNKAGVVVRYGDGRVQTACVAFDEPSISGIELLQRSGMAVTLQSSGMGAAVCKIEDEGCDYPAESCFCKCKGGDCAYWAYQRFSQGTWAYSPIGASAIQVRPGDIDGWAWGAGSVERGAQPPLMTFEEICAVAPPPTSVAEPAATMPPPAATTAATSPNPTSTPAPSAPGGSSMGDYLLFGALAVLLVGATIAALLRRRRS